MEQAFVLQNCQVSFKNIPLFFTEKYIKIFPFEDFMKFEIKDNCKEQCRRSMQDESGPPNTDVQTSIIF